MKVRDVIFTLGRDGWRLDRPAGSKTAMGSTTIRVPWAPTAKPKGRGG